MIVADASAIVEVVLALPASTKIRASLQQHSELHVPQHFHVEVMSVLRRYAVRGELGEVRAAEALAALRDLRVIAYPVMPLVDEVWELRHELTPYDAAYLALARRLGIALVTLDGGLAAVAARHGRLEQL